MGLRSTRDYHLLGWGGAQCCPRKLATGHLQAIGSEVAAGLGRPAKPFDWKNDQPDPQPDITVASIFGHRYTIRVAQF